MKISKLYVAILISVGFGFLYSCNRSDMDLVTTADLVSKYDLRVLSKEQSDEHAKTKPYLYFNTAAEADAFFKGLRDQYKKGFSISGVVDSAHVHVSGKSNSVEIVNDIVEKVLPQSRIAWDGGGGPELPGDAFLTNHAAGAAGYNVALSWGSNYANPQATVSYSSYGGVVTYTPQGNSTVYYNNGNINYSSNGLQNYAVSWGSGQITIYSQPVNVHGTYNPVTKSYTLIVTEK
jgi:hypothetical protein